MKTRLLLLIVILNFTAWAGAQERVLHNFGEGQDGAIPSSGVTLRNNRLYGTTLKGGAFGSGTVYQMDRSGADWNEVVIHDFNGTDGYAPEGKVIFDSSGNMYGTTVIGGDSGMGTVFMMSPTGNTWTETVLYSFTGGADGAYPRPQLEFDNDGNLYGTTELLGVKGGGTVFELSPTIGGWSESTLYSFTAGIYGSGAYPWAGVTYREGALYGTTYGGGSGGYGTVFKLKRNRSGWTYQVLHNFTGRDGARPMARVVFRNGILYGTTSGGGIHECGTVFALNVSSRALQSFSFCPFPDGNVPLSGVILDAENNVYGTTLAGGTSGRGAVFKLHPTPDGWTETLLYSFTGGNDGGNPVDDGLVFGENNKLYGTTLDYGSHGSGVVFELVP